MPSLTLREVNEHHGGILPPGATFRGEDDESSRPASPGKANRRTGKGDRFTLLNAFTDIGLASLTGAEAKIWMILFRDTKVKTGTARTGQADIARRAGINARTVRRTLVTLEAKGMIRVVRRGRLNGGPSCYLVHPVGAA